MVIRKNKTYFTNVNFKNSNFTGFTDVYIIDETTEEGRNLAQKIIENAPYFDFIFDDDGNLIDITPAERPVEIIENEEIDEEKIAMAEAIIDLDNRLKALEGGD